MSGTSFYFPRFDSYTKLISASFHYPIVLFSRFPVSYTRHQTRLKMSVSKAYRVMSCQKHDTERIARPLKCTCTPFRPLTLIGTPRPRVWSSPASSTDTSSHRYLEATSLQSKLAFSPRYLEATWLHLKLVSSPRYLEATWLQSKLAFSPRCLDATWLQSKLVSSPRYLGDGGLPVQMNKLLEGIPGYRASKLKVYVLGWYFK